MKKSVLMGSLFVLFVVLLSSSVFALDPDDLDDISIFGLELEKLLNLVSGFIAFVLAGLTLSAYRRNNNQRLAYVSVAFMLFGIKGFLTSHELFFNEWPIVDPLASAMSLAIMIMFFIGILKK